MALNVRTDLTRPLVRTDLPRGLVRAAAASPAFTLKYDFAGSTSLSGATKAGPVPTFSRSSTATYRDSTGTRQTAAAGEPRFDHDETGNPLGLLIEESRTNLALNSASPATQTVSGVPASAHTVWMEGTGSVDVSGATDGSFGTATEGSPVTFTPSATQDVTLTVSGTVDVFQLEGGSFPTSFIETAGSAVTRSADVCETTDIGWHNLTAGTFLAEVRSFVPPAVSSKPEAFRIIDGNNSLTLRVRGNQLGIKLVVSENGSFSTVSSGSYSANTLLKTAAAYDASTPKTTLVENGNTPVSINAVPQSASRLEIGAGFNILNGHIKSLTYYPERKSDSFLQSETS